MGSNVHFFDNGDIPGKQFCRRRKPKLPTRESMTSDPRNQFRRWVSCPLAHCPKRQSVDYGRILALVLATGAGNLPARESIGGHCESGFLQLDRIKYRHAKGKLPSGPPGFSLLLLATKVHEYALPLQHEWWRSTIPGFKGVSNPSMIERSLNNTWRCYFFHHDFLARLMHSTIKPDFVQLKAIALIIKRCLPARGIIAGLNRSLPPFSVDWA